MAELEEFDMMDEEMERIGGILKDFDNRHEKAEKAQPAA